MVTDSERFLGWALAFEGAFWSDDFAALRPLLADDARRVARSEGSLAADDAGAEAVLAGLRASVHGLARRFDVHTYLGFEPAGRRASHPFVSIFEARDGRLLRERYFFDLAQLCAGIGLPIAEVTERVAALGGAR